MLSQPTVDKIFLLSISQAGGLFENRICCPTAYAKEMGVDVQRNGCCNWLLRTQSFGSKVTRVLADGEFDYDGVKITQGGAIRPALHILLEPAE